jgi:hypothetical protein
MEKQYTSAVPDNRYPVAAHGQGVFGGLARCGSVDEVLDYLYHGPR